jgi:DNA-binding response OmpR family regulator
LNVLIIEDEDTIQGILAKFLERYAEARNKSVRIKGLHDPVQGLFELTASGNAYDLVILDVRLPKLTGDEIYNSLIQVQPALLDRVLFVTGYRQDIADRFPGLTLRILDKPFRYSDFEQAVSTIVD